MSQKAVLIRIDGELIEEVFHSVPDYNEAVQICKDNGYEYKDYYSYYSDYYCLEYEWIKIGECSGTDELITDDALLFLYGSSEFEEMVYNQFGLNVETVDYGAIEVMVKDLKED